MLYYTEKILGVKKEKSVIFKTNNANSRLFGELERGCLAWLPRMIFHPITPYSTLKTIYHGHIPRCVHIPRIRGRFNLRYDKYCNTVKVQIWLS